MSKPQMSRWLVSLYLQLQYAVLCTARACTKRLDGTQWPETRNETYWAEPRHIAPRPRWDRDETIVRLETVSKPKRLDRDHIPRHRYRLRPFVSVRRRRALCSDSKSPRYILSLLPAEATTALGLFLTVSCLGYSDLLTVFKKNFSHLSFCLSLVFFISLLFSFFLFCFSLLLYFSHYPDFLGFTFNCRLILFPVSLISFFFKNI